MIRQDLVVTFQGIECEVDFTNFADTSPKLVLYQKSTGMPYASPSKHPGVFTPPITLPDIPQTDPFCIIKDCDEYEGMVSALIDAGIVIHDRTMDYFVNPYFPYYKICRIVVVPF